MVAVVVLGFGYLDFNWGFGSDEKVPSLTLLTNNVGGRKFSTLAEFMQKENPDIVALQDTARIENLAKQYPERFIANLGEYILISKLPIRQSRLLSELSWRGHPIGTSHELQYENQSIVVYNIHMPTPRARNLRDYADADFSWSYLAAKGFIPVRCGPATKNSCNNELNCRKNCFNSYKMKNVHS